MEEQKSKFLDKEGLVKYHELLKAYIEEKTGNAGQFEYEILEALPGPDSGDVKEGIIYLVRDRNVSVPGYQYTKNILVNTGTSQTATGREWQQLGLFVMTRDEWQAAKLDLEQLYNDYYEAGGAEDVIDAVKPFFFDGDSPHQLPESYNNISKVVTELDDTKEVALGLASEWAAFDPISSTEIEGLFEV